MDTTLTLLNGFALVALFTLNLRGRWLSCKIAKMEKEEQARKRDRIELHELRARINWLEMEERRRSIESSLCR